MIYSNIRHFLLTIFIFLIIINLSIAQEVKELSYNIVVTFPTPGPSPQGLAWDGENLWITDDSTNLIYKIEPSTGRTLMVFPSPSSKPQGLTWDGNNLILSENQNRKIYKLKNSGNELFEIISSINAPVFSSHKSFNGQIGGVAWDGKYLWSSYFAGWSSKIVKIDPNNGNIDDSFFCYADYIVFDGRYLWNVAKGGRHKGVISKREIQTNKRLAFILTPGYDPAGLAFDGTYFWHADRVEKLIYKILIE